MGTRTLRLVAASLALAMGTFAPGCGPGDCAKLEARVCKEVRDKRRCKLITDPQRREHLSGEVCMRMLKALKR